MKIIFGNPGSGKTKALLEMSAKNNIPVLCESAARVQRLLVKAEGYGFKIPSPVTVLIHAIPAYDICLNCSL